MHKLIIGENSSKSEIKIVKQNLIASIKDVSLIDEKDVNYSPLSNEFFKSFQSEEQHLASSVSITTQFHIANNNFNLTKYSNSTKTYFPESN
jgi:hypothetical protein